MLNARGVLRSLMGGVALVILMSAGSARAEGVNNLLAGIQGLFEFPADPVMDTIFVPEAFEDVPLAPVTGRILGLGSGTLLGVYRAAMGAFDIALTPLWVLPTMSPQPRWELIPGVEYE